VQSELAAIDKRLQIIGDGPLENEVYVAHRQQIQARKDEIITRLPYASVADEELVSRLEDQAIEVEQLQSNLRSLPPIKGDWTDSKEAIQTQRLVSEAVERKVLLEQEQGYRFTKLQAVRGVESLAEREAKEVATTAWRKSLNATMAEMEANGAPKWEIQKVREESGQEAPAEMVETFAKDIKADWIERHPSVDPSIQI